MNRDFALIDANIARVKEGVRVLEDTARFVLRDPVLFQKLKRLRHRCLALENICGGAYMLAAREGEDHGQGPIVSSEFHRSSIYSLIRANSQRVTEALRALEEFAKVYHVDMTILIKDMRYEVYLLETALAKHVPQSWLEQYFADGIVYPIIESVEDAVWVIDHGAKIFQLRDKASDHETLYKKTKVICDVVQKHNHELVDPVLFMLNDHVDIAARLPVAGVHLGQDDTAFMRARRILGTNKIIGRSNQTLAQVFESIKLGADYVSIGPIFSTPIKADRAPIGLDVVREVARHVIVPWLAIGGIDEETINDVRDAGAKNVAVIRAVKEFFK